MNIISDGWMHVLHDTSIEHFSRMPDHSAVPDQPRCKADPWATTVASPAVTSTTSPRPFRVVELRDPTPGRTGLPHLRGERLSHLQPIRAHQPMNGQAGVSSHRRQTWHGRRKWETRRRQRCERQYHLRSTKNSRDV